jgi:hypothetical protein
VGHQIISLCRFIVVFGLAQGDASVRWPFYAQTDSPLFIKYFYRQFSLFPLLHSIEQALRIVTTRLFRWLNVLAVRFGFADHPLAQ